MSRRLTRPLLARACEELASRDPMLAALLETHGVPPLWARPAGFETLVRIMLEQQVSLASGRAAHRRLVDGLGEVSPERLLDAGPGRLRALGLTRQKSLYLTGLAAAVAEGRLSLRALARRDDEAVAGALTALKGIGPWTAEVYLLMALRRPDVWPAGDLALQRAVGAAHGWRKGPDAGRMRRVAEAWRPWRSVAARMLWQHDLAGAGQGRAARS